jgi:hypothetical protein
MPALKSTNDNILDTISFSLSLSGYHHSHHGYLPLTITSDKRRQVDEQTLIVVILSNTMVATHQQQKLLQAEK